MIDGFCMYVVIVCDFFGWIVRKFTNIFTNFKAHARATVLVKYVLFLLLNQDKNYSKTKQAISFFSLVKQRPVIP